MVAVVRTALSPTEVDEVWRRWRSGEAVKVLARAMRRHPSTVRDLLKRCGGVRPAPRRRGELRLTVAERGEISRGLAAGLSLRAIAWLQVTSLLGERLPRDVVGAMRRHLWHTGRHLIADLPYTATSMRNNHLLDREPEASRSEERVDEPSRTERYARLGVHLSSL